MLNWDLTITSMIIIAAAYYVAQSAYKTIKGTSSGCSGCCSACSHCPYSAPTSHANPAKKKVGPFST